MPKSMFYASILLRGLILGFAIAAPVGPIGILVIRRTLANGPGTGFVSGLGAATADAAYGSLAAFGLTFVSSLLIRESTWIRIIGGALLAYLGLTLVLSKPAGAATVKPASSMVKAYLSVVALTLTNPATILSFAAAFAALGLGGPHGNYAAAGVLVLGVFLGSTTWWALLTTGVSFLRTKITPAGLLWVNRLAGAALLAFGVASLLSAVVSLRRSLRAT